MNVIKNTRVAEIDALRFICMLYIVGFWHLCDYSPALWFKKVLVAEFLMYLSLGGFIFVSGLLLSARYDITRLSEFKTFYWNRFLRVYPMFLIVLLVFLILKWVKVTEFFIALFLLNMILREGLITLWFVTMIFIFYLLTPLLLYKFNYTRIIISILIIYIWLLFIYWKTDYIDIRFPLYLVIYSLGLIVARSNKLKNLINSQIGVLIFSILLIGLQILFYKFHYYFYELNQWVYWVIFVDVSMVASIPVLWWMSKFVVLLFNRQLIQMISYCSFAMYLTHRLIFAVGVELYQPTELLISILYLLGILLPLTGILSLVYQFTYDQLVNILFGNNQ